MLVKLESAQEYDGRADYSPMVWVDPSDVLVVAPVPFVRDNGEELQGTSLLLVRAGERVVVRLLTPIDDIADALNAATQTAPLTNVVNIANPELKGDPAQLAATLDYLRDLAGPRDGEYVFRGEA